MKWLVLLLASCAHSAASGGCSSDPLLNGEISPICINKDGIRMCGWNQKRCQTYLVRVSCHADWEEYEMEERLKCEAGL